MKLNFTLCQKRLKILANLRILFYSSEARPTKQLKSHKNYNFKKALQNELKGEILYGIHPVENALKAKRRTINKLYISENIFESRNERIVATLEEAERLGVNVVVMKKDILNLLSQDRPHQGLCMDVSPLKVPTFHRADTLEAFDRRIVLLDCVQDPMNMGSIIRSSYYFGFNKIFINNKNNCRATATVSKASSGAMEIISLYSVPCLRTFVRELKDQDWHVIGLSMTRDHNSIELEDAGHYREKKVAVVLGNEGSGIEDGVLQECSNLLHVSPSFHHPTSSSSPSSSSPSSSPPLSSSPSLSSPTSLPSLVSTSSSSPYLDSLNVNVVAGIVFHAFCLPPI